jgi:epoxyqueuosine reductase
MTRRRGPSPREPDRLRAPDREIGITLHAPLAQPGDFTPGSTEALAWAALTQEDRSAASPKTGATLVEALEAAARRLGFAAMGVAPVERFAEAADALDAWRSAGYAGALEYLLTPAERADPRALLPEARSLLVVAWSYAGSPPPDLVALRSSAAGAPLSGTIAGYARGEDYHVVLKRKLRALATLAATLAGREVTARIGADTEPLLEREAARRAGLGFIGKSAMLIIPGTGTRVLLGVLLTDLELPAAAPMEPRCGRCDACLVACPTQAFVAPFVLDARRCIAYLTIETEGVIPHEFRRAIGTRVFGCDVCQEACPYTTADKTRALEPEAIPRSGLGVADLIQWLDLGSAGYRKLVRRTALSRAHREQLSRNAAVALGNSGDPRAVPPLVRAVREHPLELVRAHAAWALGELAKLDADAERQVREALQLAHTDRSLLVQSEASAALARLGHTGSSY